MKTVKNDMAQIPYVAHRKRMYKAYVRERRLKIALALTNAIWIAIVLLLIVR